MSKFNFYFIALASLVLFSCNNNDDDEAAVEVIHDYAEQYAYDMKVIKTFLQKHYIKEIVDHPGYIDDQDIKFAEIDDTNLQQPIWDSPLLDSLKINKHDIEYTVYFVKTRQGTGEAPTRVDKVLTAYDGLYLYLESKKDTINGEVILNAETTSTKRFERIDVPSSYLSLYATITGFTEIMLQFNEGQLAPESPGNPSPQAYLNFGAGVMFIPCGLAYYNYATSTIPKYAQLMYKFKLYDMERDDRDGDGILSIDEDLNHDGRYDNDDTDGDGIMNYSDDDDDGDGYLTKIETRYVNPIDVDPFQTVRYYPFQGAAVDDPATPYFDESKGVPDCNGDYTSPNRLRKYLDPTCH